MGKIISRPRSREVFEQAKLTLAGGVGSSTRVYPEPLVLERAQGAHIFDIDGHKYIDFLCAYGPIILGHANQAVNDFVMAQIPKGTDYGISCRLESMASEEIAKVVPCIDLIRFSCSGSEANHNCVRLARAYTGRDKIVKFEGHYHGTLDDLYLSVKPSPPMGIPNSPWTMRQTLGQPKNVTENVIVLTWNDLDALEETLKHSAHEIAAVITEPIMFNNGGILPKEGYLSGVRELTKKYGVLFIFDEIITGFRLALGGAQEYFGVIPDLCTFAKAVANGYPISGFGGRRDIMELIANNQLPQLGTFNANPLCLAAVVATIRELSKDNCKAIRRANEIGAKLRTGLNNLFQKYNFPIKAEGGDSYFVLTSPVMEMHNYRDYIKLDVDFVHRFHAEMLSRGILFMQRGNMLTSAAHTDEDVAQAVEMAEQVIKDWSTVSSSGSIGSVSGSWY
jgi:glutamate-1-semialdehyde 2,1-aminomutase